MNAAPQAVPTCARCGSHLPELDETLCSECAKWQRILGEAVDLGLVKAIEQQKRARRGRRAG